MCFYHYRNASPSLCLFFCVSLSLGPVALIPFRWGNGSLIVSCLILGERAAIDSPEIVKEEKLKRHNETKKRSRQGRRMIFPTFPEIPLILQMPSMQPFQETENKGKCKTQRIRRGQQFEKALRFEQLKVKGVSVSCSYHSGFPYFLNPPFWVVNVFRIAALI